jgi:hypothetical protein
MRKTTPQPDTKLQREAKAAIAAELKSLLDAAKLRQDDEDEDPNEFADWCASRGCGGGSFNPW